MKQFKNSTHKIFEESTDLRCTSIKSLPCKENGTEGCCPPVQTAQTTCRSYQRISGRFDFELPEDFELPDRQLDAEVIDQFHSQASEIRHRGRDDRSSISSEPPVIPQSFSSSSIAASSENSEDGLFQSFIQSPGSARSNSSNLEQLFQNHFQVEDELLDEMLWESPADDEEVTGLAANLIPEQNQKKLQNQEDQRQM